MRLRFLEKVEYGLISSSLSHSSSILAKHGTVIGLVSRFTFYMKQPKLVVGIRGNYGVGGSGLGTTWK